MDNLQIVPVTPDRWDDLLRLFGPSGAYSNCWCTWWILRSKEWDTTPAADRRALLQSLVAGGAEPGLLAYDDGKAIGWCAAGPRERYARMMSKRSTVFRPLDDEPSWMINCFFVAEEARRQGVAEALLEAAVDFAFEKGAKRIEAYPLDPVVHHVSAASLFVGSLPMFLAAGFTEVARLRGRPVVRLERR